MTSYIILISSFIIGKIGAPDYYLDAVVKKDASTTRNFCVPMRGKKEKSANTVGLKDAEYLLEWRPNGSLVLIPPML